MQIITENAVKQTWNFHFYDLGLQELKCEYYPALFELWREAPCPVPRQGLS